MKSPLRLVPLSAALLGLVSCQSAAVVNDSISRPGDNSALSTMERIAVAAQKCWFSGKDDGFKGLAMSPELTSFSGKPRILAVPKGNIGGLPRLVVEATGKPAKLVTYGPLMDGPHGPSITADTQRWASGDTACAQRA